jgi:thioredoxin-related protein
MNEQNQIKLFIEEKGITYCDTFKPKIKYVCRTKNAYTNGRLYMNVNVKQRGINTALSKHYQSKAA